VAEVAYIRPGGDLPADDLATWAGQLRDLLTAAGHPSRFDISVDSSCDRPTCEAALRTGVPLVTFFGHGDLNALLGSFQEPVIDENNLTLAAGKTLVSVACEAGREIGPAAIQAGVRAHLGWNVLLLWLGSDAATYGEAIVEPLSRLGVGASISEVSDALRDRFNAVAQLYRPRSAYDSNAKLAYYAAAAAAGQIAIDGDRHVRPLADGLSSAIRWGFWRVERIGKSVIDSIRGVGRGQ
jgi:hypothetical protein